MCTFLSLSLLIPLFSYRVYFSSIFPSSSSFVLYVFPVVFIYFFYVFTPFPLLILFLVCFLILFLLCFWFSCILRLLVRLLSLLLPCNCFFILSLLCYFTSFPFLRFLLCFLDFLFVLSFSLSTIPLNVLVVSTIFRFYFSPPFLFRHFFNNLIQFDLLKLFWKTR